MTGSLCTAAMVDIKAVSPNEGTLGQVKIHERKGLTRSGSEEKAVVTTSHLEET